MSTKERLTTAQTVKANHSARRARKRVIVPASVSPGIQTDRGAADSAEERGEERGGVREDLRIVESPVAEAPEAPCSLPPRASALSASPRWASFPLRALPVPELHGVLVLHVGEEPAQARAHQVLADVA